MSRRVRVGCRPRLFWVRQFISVPRCGDFSGTAFLGAAFRRTQVGLLGTAFPGCGNLFPDPGAAISQVRLSWVRQFAVPRSVFPGYGFSWVRQFISGPRCGNFSGTAFLGAAFAVPRSVYPGSGFSWVRQFISALRYGFFPGCGNLPYPGRSFQGAAFPGCGNLFPYPGTAFFLGTAICRTQVGLFQGTAFPGCGNLFPHSGTAFFLGTAISRTQVGLFQGTAFPGSGFSWVRLFLGVRRFASSSPGPAFSQVRLFLGPAFFPVKEQLLE